MTLTKKDLSQIKGVVHEEAEMLATIVNKGFNNVQKQIGELQKQINEMRAEIRDLKERVENLEKVTLKQYHFEIQELEGVGFKLSSN